ncbi:hypothetical protein E2C01_038292 [Portunus trituberculatus]|uniref:Uncharacterized protein n=1 Tax=Portunus trituberculatus TaxID=210409 RepID=A0A5B7FGW2_PORTR|nr:hypothetical protein [Portunus trituberculatus]
MAGHGETASMEPERQCNRRNGWCVEAVAGKVVRQRSVEWRSGDQVYQSKRWPPAVPMKSSITRLSNGLMRPKVQTRFQIDFLVFAQKL